MNKQLFEKESNSYKPIYPLVRLEDIIETISDKSIQWILNNYNHIYVEYSESVAITRNKVPQLLRRTGIWISYNAGTEVITEYYKGDNKDVTNFIKWTNDDNWERFDKIKHLDGSITYQHLSESLRQLIGQGNNITNFPDDEDLEVKDGLLKLKDRDFEPNNFSGLGRVILRKNIKTVDGQPKNVLTQDMINKENTIYEIRYDFDLNGQEITIPEGCVLDFQGGSLNNGAIVGEGLILKGFECLKNIQLKGSSKYFDFRSLSNNVVFYWSFLKTIIENQNDYYNKTIDVLIDNNISAILNESRDFKGLTINITNNKNSLYLFSLTNDYGEIILDKSIIDSGDFTSVEEINNRKVYLLHVYDSNLWCEREGESHEKFTRRDLLYIINGQSANKVISPYDNEQSIPKCYICESTNSIINISNLHIRTKGTYGTALLVADYVDKLTIDNISVTVENPEATDAGVFSITNSSNISFIDCKFINSYDEDNTSAYIFYLNNVYNVTFDRIISSSKNWGVIGTKNVNKITITESTLNIMDVHCYGKSINLIRVNFIGNYNNINGIFDYILFDSCEFNNEFPLLLSGHYKTWRKSNVIFNNCTFNTDAALKLFDPIYDLSNEREELRLAVLPNIIFKKCSINKGYFSIINTSYSNVAFNGELNIKIESTLWKALNYTSLNICNNKITLDVFEISFIDTNIYGLLEEDIVFDSNNLYNYKITFNSIFSKENKIKINYINSFMPYIWHKDNVITCIKDSIVYDISYNRNLSNTIYATNSKLYFNLNKSAIVLDKGTFIDCTFVQYSNPFNLNFTNANYEFIRCKSDLKLWLNSFYSDITEEQSKNFLSDCRVNKNKVIFTSLFSYENLPNLASKNSMSFIGNSIYYIPLNKPIWWTGDKWVDATGADV